MVTRTKVDIVEILPSTLPSKHKVLWKGLNRTLIRIFVKKHAFVGGRTTKPIVMKRFILFDELFFEGMGLWFGDGHKLSSGKFKVFGFTNTSIELHRHFLLSVSYTHLTLPTKA